MKRIFFVGLLLVFAVTVFAQVVYDDATAIRQGANIEWFRSSVAISEGVVYVWSDTRDGGRDLFAQLIDAQGNLLWGPLGLVVDNKPDRQEDPMVIASSDGNVIVAWVDFAFDPDGDIWANKISPAGTKLWGDGVVVCNAGGEQVSINLVPDDAGGAYIAWSDNRESTIQIYMQHLNAHGVPSWTTNGIMIDNSPFHKGSNTLWEDTAGGAVMAYVTVFGTSLSNDNCAIRYMRFHYGSSGPIVWGPQPLASHISPDPSPLTSPQFNPKMAPDGDGGFIFAWEVKDPTIDNTVRLQGQRILLDGTKLWGDEGINITGAFPVSRNQEKHRIVEVGTGGAIIAWEDSRNASAVDASTDIFMQRLALDGSQMWTDGGIPLYLIPGCRQDNLRMTKTADGGAVIVWEDSRNISPSQKQIFAQRVNSSGVFQWGAGGKLMSDTGGGQTGGNVKVLGDSYAVVWADMRTGSLGLMTQLVSASGASLYDADGITLFYGLSGNADYFVARAFGDKTFIVWEDSRHGVFGSKIYYQIVDASGAEVMPHNGSRVSVYDTPLIMREENMVAEINPQGEMCIIWSKNIDGSLSYHAQIINQYGEKLLGAFGLELRQNASAGNTLPFITWKDNGWEIYWNENRDVTGNSAIYGQRIVGTSLTWGATAKLIQSEEGDASHTLTHKSDSYLLVTRSTQGMMGAVVENRLLRIDGMGNIAPGWEPFGKKIFEDYNVLNASHFFVKDDQIILFYTDVVTIDGNSASNLLVAIFDLDGNPYFDAHIVNVTPGEADKMETSIYQQGDLFMITYTYLESYLVGGHLFGAWKTNSQRIKITNEGVTFLWGDTGKLALPSENDPTISHEQIASMPIGNQHAVVWVMTIEDSEEKSVFMSILDSSGMVSSHQNGILVCVHEKDQQSPQIISHHDKDMTIAWLDGISSGKEHIYGLYIQKIKLTDVPNVDVTNDIPFPITARGNYPNPFNPETTIAFDLRYSSIVKVDVYNVKGQKVRSLIDDYMPAGRNIVIWNGQNDSGKSVSSGMYFYRIDVGGAAVTKKMMLIK